MQAIPRYVLAEFLKVLTISLVGMTALIILVLVGQQAVREGIGIGPLVRLVPFALPEAMRFAVPGTVLLASTFVYGRMASQNEIIALKAMGISPLLLVWPVLALAGFISLATVWLNDVAVSWGRKGMQRVIIESVEETAYGILKARKSFSNDKLTINVRDVDGKRLVGPVITVKQGAGKPDVTIDAREAQLHADLDEGQLTIQLVDTDVEIGNKQGLVLPGNHPYVVPLADLSRRAKGKRRPSEIPLHAIATAVRQQQDQIAALGRQLAVAATYQLILGDLPALTGQQWRERRHRLSSARETLHRLRTEPHRRWANGFSCLCFALVGMPMAIRRRHGEFLASFFICFLPILIVYYPFLMVSVDHAKQGQWPPQSVWLGNIVFLLWGWWLLRRVIRY